jgi:hypothetical protein
VIQKTGFQFFKYRHVLNHACDLAVYYKDENSLIQTENKFRNWELRDLGIEEL